MLSVTIILASFACLAFSIALYILADALDSVSFRERTLGMIIGSFAGLCVGIGTGCIQFLMIL